jgi:hypothetical protein
MTSIKLLALLILSFMGIFALPLVHACISNGHGGCYAPPTTIPAAAASTIISSSLCGIITNVQAVVGVIALALFVLGGACYGIAHMLPAAGNIKGSMQGWALGMVIGGIVGLIIVIIAPGIINLIASSAGHTLPVTSCT